MKLERARPEGCLSDLRHDRLLAGELGEADRRVAEAHISTCGVCQARAAALRASRERLSAALPPLRRPTAAPTPPPRLAWLWRPTPLLTAAAAALALLLAWPTSDAPLQVTERRKGGPSLGFFILHGEAIRVGEDGEAIAPGDAVRFAYSTAEAGFLLIASVDGVGARSVYYAGEGGRAAPIEASGHQPLPESVVLDDALGPERVYGFFCRAAIEEAAALRALGGPEPPEIEGCRVAQIRWVKRAP